MYSIKPKISETFYLVFEDAPKRRWFTRWLKAGYSHCYVMKKSEAGLFWLVINPSWSHVIIDYRLVDTFPSPQDYAGDYAKVVEYRALIDPSVNSSKLGLCTCTDIVMRMIGLKSFKVFTPYQLYKAVASG